MTRSLMGALVAALFATAVAAALPAAAESKKGTTTASSVTLTGCLQAEGGKYVLTGLPADQAPTARSWKTAYIRKTTRNVEVVSASTGPKLKDQVGHKVTVVGTRDSDTHVQVRSVKRVAASCS